MGFGFRKSVNLGKGLRLNLSKSGLGLSGGMKGLRVSSNAKGVYFYSGKNGVYYRKKLSNVSDENEKFSYFEEDGSIENMYIIKEVKDSINGFIDIENKYAMRDLNNILRFEKHKLGILWVLVMLGLFTKSLSLLFIPIIIIVIAHYRKKYKIEVNIDKDLNDINCCFDKLGDDYDFAHAQTLEEVLIGIAKIKYYLEKFVPVIKYKGYSIYFLNDSILFFDNTIGVFKIPFSELIFSSGETCATVINPPAGLEILASTWEHPNKDGSPSKRYKVNRQVVKVKAYIIEICCKGSFSFPMLVLNKKAYKNLVNILPFDIRELDLEPIDTEVNCVQSSTIKKVSKKKNEDDMEEIEEEMFLNNYEEYHQEFDNE